MMKRLLFLTLGFIGMAVVAATISTKTFDAPAVVGANSTNVTVNAEINLSDLITKDNPLVSLSASFTNPTAQSSGSVIIFFSSSRDGTNFDTAAQSNIKLTANMDGSSPILVGDFFNLVGIKLIKVGRIENSSGGAISNFTAKMSWPSAP